MATKEKVKSSDSNEDLLKVARERFDLASEAEQDIRALALEDLKFSAGEQWPEDVLRARTLDRRPCLTINRLPQLVRQITNDQRQNRPSIKVSPVDDNADIDTAKIFQGIIRHIEYSSDADTAYDTAFDSAVRTGFGYFRIVTEFSDPMSFEQDIRVKRVRNRFSVYLDPSYQQPDGSDANWGFVFEDMSADDFKAQYPNSELATMNDWSSIGDSVADWVSDKVVRIAEYFYKEFEDQEIVQLALPDGTKQVVLKSEIDGMPLAEGVQVLGVRKTSVPVVKWAKINAVEVLEETTWPGKWIPIIPVLGEELDIDGKRVLAGIVRHAKDPQRMYNYWASSETETIALAPRAPFIGVEGQFEGHEEQWQSANVRNHAYLQYKPKTIGGQPVGPPQRNVFEPPIQAITQARMQSSEDMKATTGIYDAALGNRSNENSGIAIQRRSMQTQTSNFHFVDNLSKSIRHAGRILVDMIPKVLDTDRAIRTLGEDGSEEVVKINQVFQKNGEDKVYDLGAGKYDVTVNTGPSFESKRQEAVQAMLEFTKAVPNAAALISDLLVKNMDWPGAAEIAERLKKTLPPGIADDKDQKQKMPPEAEAQMQQMGQLIEQLTGQLNSAQDDIDKKRLELESRERIEMKKLEVAVEMKLAEMGSKEGMALLQHEIAEIGQRLQMLHVDQPIEDLNGAGPEMSQQGQQMGQPPMMEEEAQQPTGGLSPGNYMGEQP